MAGFEVEVGFFAQSKEAVVAVLDELMEMSRHGKIGARVEVHLCFREEVAEG